MFVFYTFCAVMGAVFVALSWLRVPPARLNSPEGEGAVQTPAPRRWWALPLCFSGLVGGVLVLLERPLLLTLTLSVVVGVPVGLIARWVSDRIHGAEPRAAHASPQEPERAPSE